MSESSSDKENRLCFLIGPIGGEGTPIRKLADWVLDGLVKPVLEAEPFYYEVLRADADDRPGEITSQVIERIVDSELVVADLTGLNPNVMYELAIRHMVSKPVIQLCDSETALPFDVQNARTIKFDISDYAKVNDTKELIKRHALGIEEQDFVVSNPVTAANKIAEMNTSSDSTEQMVAALFKAVTRIKGQITLLEQRTARDSPIPASNLLKLAAADNRASLANMLMSKSDTGVVLGDLDTMTLSEILAQPVDDFKAPTPIEGHLSQPTLGTTLSAGEDGKNKAAKSPSKKKGPDSS